MKNEENMIETIKNIAKTTISLMSLIGLIGITGCSKESGEQPVANRTRMEVVAFAPDFVEAETPEAPEPSSPATRAWTPPTGYVLFSSINNLFTNQKNLENRSIRAFFTKDGETPLDGTFFYRESTKKWWLNTDLESDTYYLYGYFPAESASSASIAPNGTYEDGAIITINGLSTLTPSDVCVIIGAKEGNSAEDHNGLQAGKFAVETKAKDSGDNYIFLLFDHLYSAVRFSLSVDAGYAALREIHLRKLELIAYTTGGVAGVRAKYNARVTLLKNETGTSPIVGSVEFTPDESSALVAPVSLFDALFDDEITLKTTPTDLLGSFVPGDNNYFKLRSTYDVFDKKGNLLRQNCQAENTIDLRDMFGSYLETRRGHVYSLALKVQPTYLYMLSEPDLENPTVTLQ